MPPILLYLFKLSVSLAVVWLFYQLVLRRLTFYNWNRWYLFAYSVACFFIPFIDINPVLHRNEWTDTGIVQLIPVVSGNAVSVVSHHSTAVFNYWNLAVLLFITGAAVLLCRLALQLLSFRRMMRRAKLISEDGLKVYQLDESIIPFSFGNAVFINRYLHTAAELEEIIRHEFVHARQRHSMDIIWGELLCLLNWYNPFAWLLRKSIRQNLEFIADSKVIENGIDKKQYQYLLLKVIGNSQFSIATSFNFSSLKKRIAMMNKLKSAKRNLFRFLFILPLLMVILISFRKEIGDSLKKGTGSLKTTIPVTDTIPDVTTPNDKGYYIDIKDKKGECEVVIKNKNKKEVKRLLLTEWNEKTDFYENLYGQIPPAPPPPPPPILKSSSMSDFLKRNSSVKEVGWVYNNDNSVVIMQINKKDGTTERYNLENDKERETAEDKYGNLPVIPPPAPPAKEAAPATFAYKDKKVTVIRRDGKKEEYDLADPVQETEFKTLYDRPVLVATETESPVEVVVAGRSLATTKPLGAVVVEEKPLNAKTITGVKTTGPVRAKTSGAVEINMVEKPLKLTGELKEITIEEKPVVVTDKPMKSTKTSPALKEVVILDKPVTAKTKTVTADVNLVFEEIPVESGIINIGGLSLKNEKQYILVDGKEYDPQPGDKLKGTYRITFIDKQEAEKKYGAKAKNGAIIAETIK